MSITELKTPEGYPTVDLASIIEDLIESLFDCELAPTTLTQLLADIIGKELLDKIYGYPSRDQIAISLTEALWKSLVRLGFEGVMDLHLRFFRDPMATNVSGIMMWYDDEVDLDRWTPTNEDLLNSYKFYMLACQGPGEQHEKA